MKPRIFVGCSVEGLKIAEAVQQKLDYYAFTSLWQDNIFKASQSYLSSLIQSLDNFDFAIFIFNPDDTVISRGDEFSTVRDNVLYEMGLFTGRLGMEKVFFLKPRSIDVKIPSDLLGISAGSYDDKNTDLNSAIGPFITEIKKRIDEQFVIIFPDNGFWGKNILSDNNDKFNSGVQNCISSKAPKGVILHILMKNLSSGNTPGNENNCWGFSWGKQQNLDPVEYDYVNHLQYIRFMSHEAMSDIIFRGSGSAELIISIDDNGTLMEFRRKTIYWG